MPQWIKRPRPRSPMDQPIDRDGVERIFRDVLGRPVWDDDYTDYLVKSGRTFGEVLATTLDSDECASRMSQRQPRAGSEAQRLEGPTFLTPRDLRVTPDAGGRCLLIGGCFFDCWYDMLKTSSPQWSVESVLFENVLGIPQRRAADLEGVEFQIIQPPARRLIGDTHYFAILSGAIKPEDTFKRAVEAAHSFLEQATRYTREFSIPAFVLGLAVPQTASLGRFSSTHDADGVASLFLAVNAEIEAWCRKTAAVHYYDLDGVFAMLGKRYNQDDIVTHGNHGGFLGAIATLGEGDRLHPIGDSVDLYRPRLDRTIRAIFEDVVGAYRALQQIDQVKLAVFDLDDTLWRGVAAETDDLTLEAIEGWPLGVLDALATLAGRGVLVALVSKNDPAVAERAWNAHHGLRFPWDAFFAREVSWDDKAAGMARIIAKANVHATATLLIDDNPIERARVMSALPGVRTLEAPVAEWRRILLWSPELQTPTVTAEARSRAGSLQARTEAPLPAETKEAFLERLAVKIKVDALGDHDSPEFTRIFELLNKTNQFNTTGRRWKLPEIRALLDAGGHVLYARVSDAYSSYGITAIALVSGAEIVQIVMSCRVFGLGVEDALLSAVLDRIRFDGAAAAVAQTVPTGRNTSSLDVYAKAGFEGPNPATGGSWRLDLEGRPRDELVRQIATASNGS